MENKKKIMISAGIASVAAILMAVLVATNTNAPFATSELSALHPEIDVPYATELADTIVIGMITDTRTESWPNPDFPLVSIATLKVESYLYNPQDAKTLEIRDFGEGTYEDPNIGKVKFTVHDKTDLKENEKVLLFLDYDKGNVMGDGYYVVGASQGKYTVQEDGSAKNPDSSKDATVEEIEKTIKETLAKKEKN